ncbi:unnamed protein product [Rotaria sordida]|uniref:Uncharacterized protein n=1 Tax=Rotaria sordida TaxID=392033 RepID=A0A814UY44_9BILA|nr:unnamed protein product [Rotaria sordida]CAF1229497.1 unnamed protein product [Rotaria sordida]CAF1231770.1 unnamed protein product [Rotaria sordida]CAF3613310.1 unnamed protein product [Rotaria sordida]CAF3658861.1 unnamed protein product [Rotaria sordida]
MQQVWIGFILLVLSWSLSIDGKFIRKGPLNETLLVGQILGPTGDAVRNLMGMILSINVFVNRVVLHNSLIPITTNTFPLNYSIVLTDNDFKLENAKSFYIVSMIWQPAYIYENHVKLTEKEIDTLDFHMRAIRFVIIRGEIIHYNHSKGHDLPATKVKLELIEDKERGHIIDQVDFTCTSKTYPCRFEYWLDTVRVKANVEYKLEAVIADHILPSRKTTHQKHTANIVETKSTIPVKFKIDPTVDTEINNYQIIVVDVL